MVWDLISYLINSSLHWFVMIKIVFSLKSFVFHIWFCNPSEFFWCDVRYDSFLFHINFFSMTYQYWYWFVLWPLSYTKFIVHFLSFCVCLIGLFLLFLKSHCLKYSPVILSQDYISFLFQKFLANFCPLQKMKFRISLSSSVKNSIVVFTQWSCIYF